MKTIIEQLDARFRAALVLAFGFESDPMLGPATNERFGDYQANLAMGLSKTLAEKTGEKANPRATAEMIIQHLDLEDMAKEVSIAGPGFINVRLSESWLSGQLNSLRNDERLGVDPVGNPETVVVDYSGPNIAKQMHVGHLRSTIIGDAISRVVEFLGNRVVRQNHIGDWGTQFGMLITFLRESGEAAGSHIDDLEGFYREAKCRFDQDQGFQERARETVVRLQGGQTEELQLWKLIVDETRRHYLPIYERLGVGLSVDDERGESFYNSLLAPVVEELRDSGVAVESEGAVVVFCDGFATPLIIEKSGGGYLYATTDLAAIRYRVRELKATRIIYTHDSRQSQHFAQVFDAARRAGWVHGVTLEYAPFGTMLGEDGRPFKTRSGDTVRLKDLLDEAVERAFTLVTGKNPQLSEQQRASIAAAAGIGGIKYSDLCKDRISDYIFSWEKILSLDGNTAPYLQYAYARVQSIFRKAGIEQTESGEVCLGVPQELALARQILRFGEVIETVARELKPHHLCTYLFELATRFTSFYENCPVLMSDEPVRASRLTLCSLTARTLGLGLSILGIEHPEQM